MEVGGQFYVPVALSLRMNVGAHWTGDGEGSIDGLDVLEKTQITLSDKIHSCSVSCFLKSGSPSRLSGQPCYIILENDSVIK